MKKLTGEALEARRAYNREYMRRWRREHPERAADSIIRYWEGDAKRAKAAEQAGGEADG